MRLSQWSLKVNNGMELILITIQDTTFIKQTVLQVSNDKIEISKHETEKQSDTKGGIYSRKASRHISYGLTTIIYKPAACRLWHVAQQLRKYKERILKLNKK